MTAMQGRRSILGGVVVPVVLVILIGVYLGFGGGDGNRASAVASPASSCGDGSPVRRAAFLIDLRKPLDSAHAALPGALLARTANQLATGTEIGVYALSPHAEAPRMLLGRLCKAIDFADFDVESTKHRATGDCDVPAQASATVRARAREFCRQRDTLVRRIDALAAETLGAPVGPAYLVEAFEATAREFDGEPGTLHVFSDLKQHAPWFSHAGTPHQEWQYERMATAWSARSLAEPLAGFPPTTAVRVHYVPRTGTTDEEDVRTAHKRFWEGYFQGADVAFDDQPTMPGYVAPSLVEAPTAMELAAYELERLRHLGVVVEQERAQVAQERAELGQERAAIARDRESLDAERRELAIAREQALASTTAGSRTATGTVGGPGTGEGG